jgi:hypothetical protein
MGRKCSARLYTSLSCSPRPGPATCTRPLGSPATVPLGTNASALVPPPHSAPRSFPDTRARFLCLCLSHNPHTAPRFLPDTCTRLVSVALNRHSPQLPARLIGSLVTPRLDSRPQACRSATAVLSFHFLQYPHPYSAAVQTPTLEASSSFQPSVGHLFPPPVGRPTTTTATLSDLCSHFRASVSHFPVSVSYFLASVSHSLAVPLHVLFLVTAVQNAA